MFGFIAQQFPGLKIMDLSLFFRTNHTNLHVLPPENKNDAIRIKANSIIALILTISVYTWAPFQTGGILVSQHTLTDHFLSLSLRKYDLGTNY